jgi:DNA-binding transcriptional LysR family regulator
VKIQQVRYFVALCETLNFTRAAERCNVTHPSLTRAIRQLEDELGGPLLHRERNRTHLTELGRLMRPYLGPAGRRVSWCGSCSPYSRNNRAPARLTERTAARRVAGYP